MTHKEFYFWLQGFLSGKGNLNASDILTIQKKMEKIKDDTDYSDFLKKRNSTDILNPIHVKIENDDLGKPPKIVM